jgi:hypothetical protein
MGARVRVTQLPALSQSRQWNGRARVSMVAEPVRIDIAHDAHGEYFDVRLRRDAFVNVLDVQSGDRHLLLSAVGSQWPGQAAQESKFLCGHDERAWFTAAIPEKADVRNVQDAKDALKPEAVWEAMREFGVPMDQRDHRRTEAFVRQGEWFFIPRPNAPIDLTRVLRNEPIRRGAGKPHMCELLYQYGGEPVRVCSSFPNGLTDAEFEQLTEREQKRWHWHVMTRGACAFVKGMIRHPDHEPVWLDGWHEVVMNTETQALAMKHVAFLD